MRFTTTTCGVVASGVVRAAPAQGSQLVLVQDGRAWSGPGWSDQDLDPTVLDQMLRQALCELVSTSNYQEALYALFDPPEAKRRIGIKVNCVNPDLPSHPRVTQSLINCMRSAGYSQTKIIVFDRMCSDLTKCGYTIQTDSNLLVYGTDHPLAGYAVEAKSLTDGLINLSRILTEQIDYLINLPVLKNHEMAGVTLALKNHFGSVHNPMRLHGGDRDCCPAIAELNALDEIRKKTRLVLVDAMFATYQSGLAAMPDIAPMTLLVGRDPVAVDAYGQSMINLWRNQDALAKLDAKHITQASQMGLGQSLLSSIPVREIRLAPVEQKPKPWENKELGGCQHVRANQILAGLLGVTGLGRRL